MNSKIDYCDLHCHSTHSDGTLSEVELVRLAKANDLATLSITDHDNVSAFPLAKEEAKNLGITLIPGVEFSSYYKEESIHVLGYSFESSHPAIEKLVRTHKDRRLERNEKILLKLKEKGIVITMDELYKEQRGSVGRPHIGNILIQKGVVKDIQDAFQRYLGDKASCFVPGFRISVEETLHTIHEAGGLAVLAHPHLYSGMEIVRELLKLPFDGLECLYARMSEKKNSRFQHLAKKHSLLITGGSDFHGENKKEAFLGSAKVDNQFAIPLIQHFLK